MLTEDRIIMKFDNVQGDWFADVPNWIAQGGPIEALQMVLGADELLSELAYDEESVTLFITTNEITQGIKLKKDNEEDGGWWYWVSIINEPSLQDANIPERIWLCGVTSFVFNCFPKHIYVRKV